MNTKPSITEKDIRYFVEWMKEIERNADYPWLMCEFAGAEYWVIAPKTIEVRVYHGNKNS